MRRETPCGSPVAFSPSRSALLCHQQQRQQWYLRHELQRGGAVARRALQHRHIVEERCGGGRAARPLRPLHQLKGGLIRPQRLQLVCALQHLSPSAGQLG
eukprot:3683186-Pyramimonas_sp.AAC.1